MVAGTSLPQRLPPIGMARSHLADIPDIHIGSPYGILRSAFAAQRDASIGFEWYRYPISLARRDFKGIVAGLRRWPGMPA